MKLIVRKMESVPPALQQVEIVERKGTGHPDTICDAVAEHICVDLCRYYLEHFGSILHHNVDKILLAGGSSTVGYGGGELVHPIEIYLGGRATTDYKGQQIPVDEIARNACRNWLAQHLQNLNVDRDLRIIPCIRSGSADLVDLFQCRQPVANDTSCAAGFAPFSDLERLVLEVERTLNSHGTKSMCPAIGSDIKVMGVRHERRIELTVSCALISKFVPNLDEYVRQKENIARLSQDAARRITSLTTATIVNAADQLDSGRVFLTVTGTSAESGDDGEVGRGNRASGLITPYRSMTMEAVAGKNPVTHVGKLYNLVASRISQRSVTEIPEIEDAQCILASRIGHAVSDPQIVDVCLNTPGRLTLDRMRDKVRDVVHDELEGIERLRTDLLNGRLQLC